MPKDEVVVMLLHVSRMQGDASDFRCRLRGSDLTATIGMLKEAKLEKMSDDVPNGGTVQLIQVTYTGDDHSGPISQCLPKYRSPDGADYKTTIEKLKRVGFEVIWEWPRT